MAPQAEPERQPQAPQVPNVITVNVGSAAQGSQGSVTPHYVLAANTDPTPEQLDIARRRFNSFTRDGLRLERGGRGLSQSGLKAELVERLIVDDARRGVFIRAPATWVTMFAKRS